MVKGFPCRLGRQTAIGWRESTRRVGRTAAAITSFQRRCGWSSSSVDCRKSFKSSAVTVNRLRSFVVSPKRAGACHMGKDTKPRCRVRREEVGRVVKRIKKRQGWYGEGRNAHVYGSDGKRLRSFHSGDG